MYLDSISLRNFRNFISENIKFHESFNVIKGENGQGKTNLLEAIYYLCTGYSFRTYYNDDLVYWRADSMAVQGDIIKGDIDRKLEIFIVNNSRKFKINGKACPSVVDYSNEAKAVCILTEDNNLVKGTPSIRRNFIDSILCKIDPVYIGKLQQFNKILGQRNYFLFSLNGRDASFQLDSWTDKLCKEGAWITYRRIKLLSDLLSEADAVQKIFSLEKEKFEGNYQSSIGDISGLSLTDIELKYKEAEKKAVKEEIKQKVTLIGPHRDDVIFLLNGESARKFASQGQARTLSIGLKIAEYCMLESIFKYSPILLLDDVLFELDNSRRESVLSYVKKKSQLFIIEGHSFLDSPVFKEGIILYIEQGKVRVPICHGN